MCFGEALPQRKLDPRVVRAIARIGKFCGEPVDGGYLLGQRRACRPRASCICSSRKPASLSVRSAPGSARVICCTSPIRTSISRTSRRTSAIRIRPISAIRSAGFTGSSRARSSPARAISRSIAAGKPRKRPRSRSSPPSLREAKATKQSILRPRRDSGLLRFARNDDHG